MKILITYLIYLFFLDSAQIRASILPPNNLHLQRNFNQGGLDRSEFERVANAISERFTPIVANFGAKLVIHKLWEKPEVNARAFKSGDVWNIELYGGLARRTEVNADAFTLVVCHELGHHLGGFPFKHDTTANEGQSDYYSSQVCARNLWSGDLDLNSSFADLVDPNPKSKCDKFWTSEDERNLCYRIAVANHALSSLFASAIDKKPEFSTPDLTKVLKTSHLHPNPQCRLDTFMAGSLCKVTFDEEAIPGSSAVLNLSQQEHEALAVSCSQFTPDFELAGRPACWFHESLKKFDDKNRVAFHNVMK
jgi:hypothetical protein